MRPLKSKDKKIKFGTTALRVESTKYTSIINEFSKENIFIFDIKIENNYIDFTIKNKDCKKTFAILKNLCYNYTIIRQGTYKLLGKYICGKLGIIFGIIFGIVVCYISSLYIWDIQIQGNDYINKSDILSALQSCGVKIGGKKANCEFLTTKCLDSFYGIKQSSVHLYGNKLVIDVQPRLRPNVDTVDNMVSLYDAVVTKVITKNGTAQVKKGDIISKGTTLIKGYELDSNGEQLRSVIPKGEVYGIVNFNAKAKVDNKIYEFVRTGKKQKFTQITMFNKDIFKPKSPDFTYDCEVSKAKWNLLFPAYFTTNTYFETKLTPICLTTQQAVLYTKEKLLEDMLAFIHTKNYEVSTYLDEDNGSTLYVYVSAEIKLN